MQQDILTLAKPEKVGVFCLRLVLRPRETRRNGCMGSDRKLAWLLPDSSCGGLGKAVEVHVVVFPRNYFPGLQKWQVKSFRRK